MTNEGIIIFKDTFEYYKEGELNAKQFSELMMLIYSTRWEDKVIEDKDIKDTKIRLIWKTLKHSVIKSKNNSNNNKKKKETNKVVTSENNSKNNISYSRSSYVFKPPYENIQEKRDKLLEDINNNQPIQDNYVFKKPHKMTDEELEELLKDNNQPIQDNYVFKPPYKNLKERENRMLETIKNNNEESIGERLKSRNTY